MALSDYAPLIAYGGAAVAFYGGGAVATLRGWIRTGGRLHVALFGLGGLLAHRFTQLLGRWSDGTLGSGAEAAAGGEAFYLLGAVLVFSIGMALVAVVEAVMRRRGPFGWRP